jgi:O-methyltransferase involved in polyketide biosynthesis
MSSERISPTAYYTGEVWVRSGHAPGDFSSFRGKVLHGLLRAPMQLTSALTNGLHLDRMLIQRHSILDHQSMEFVEHDGFGQVIELAAGLSPRGVRVRRRSPEVRYIEVDLPGMVERKREMLQHLGVEDDEHIVVAGDILEEEGPRSLSSIVERYAKKQVPTVFITEGLLNYFPRDVVESLWRQIASCAAHFGTVRYISDLHLASDIKQEPVAKLFTQLLGIFARGSISMDFEDPDSALHALLDTGFETAELTTPEDWRRTVALPPSGRHTVLRMLFAEGTAR